jgi:threonine/homoserine/homoserine lactone efflux protein
MLDPTKLQIFVVAALALLITPGPAVLYIVTRSVSQGRVAGLVSCLGISTGGLVHVIAAAFGLSALLASSAAAFSVVQYLGAAYLMLLGIQALRTPPPAADAPLAVEGRSLARIFWQGAVVNVLNPKTGLFFLAFLPQFVDASRGPVTPQLLLLGFLFEGMGLCTDSTWALVSGGAGAWLRRRPQVVRSQRYVTGSVYLGLGLATAVAGHGKH